MAHDKIYQQCPRCNGTGKVYNVKPNPPHGVEVECTHCEGEGAVYWGELRKGKT